MKWGILIGLWLALLVYFVWECFQFLPRGEKKELWVFGGWLFLVGILISVNIHSSAADPRFAELFLRLFY
ncbi:MAG: hypothetical protein FWF88_07455 [Peptococcaceae bacterium]|nr:hypothetical protein [Peptococcaceae bacterium]MDR2736701.1 hypothetical protein [Gracilibacteraceae bacterium]